MDPEPDASRTLSVPCDVLSVTLVRKQLAAHLDRLGCSEALIRDAASVLSELLMNAIVHGEGDDDDRVSVTWTLEGEGTLTIEVADSGGRRPHLEVPSSDEGGGRGLRLVDRISHRWQVDTSDGTRVSAVLTPGGTIPARRRR